MTIEAMLASGRRLRQSGQFDAAAVGFERIITRAPGNAEAHRHLIDTMRQAGRPADALACTRRAIDLCPAEADFLQDFAELAAGFRFTRVDEALVALLLRMLDHPGVQPAFVGAAVLSAVGADPAIAGLLTAARPGARPFRSADALAEAVARLTANRLLLRYLGLIPVCDPAFERLLTQVRRGLLDHLAILPAGPALAFAAALASQCFINEYVFRETGQETALVNGLVAGFDAGSATAPLTLAVIAAYRPLHRLDFAARLAGHDWPPPLGDLVRLQVAEPLAEARLRDEIRPITAIDDAVSVAVRAQYEDNPYPRWTRPALAPARRPVRDLVAAMSGGMMAGGESGGSRTEVLVAGCGTGLQSIWAATLYPGASVLAIDLSLTSLAYALRQTRGHRVEGIEYAQADILELGTLDRRFDVIECGGVLHHLADPLAGWRVLAGLLKPGGLMKIALYSQQARRAEVAARRFIAKKGYTGTPSDIRRFRQDVLALPPGHAVAPVTESADFYTTSACRDHLFHVQEHRFTLARIEAALAELELRFCGFYFLESDVAADFGRRFPDDPGMLSLENWRTFESDHPLAFRQMYQFGALKPA